MRSSFVACSVLAATVAASSANADLVSNLAVDNFFDLYISTDDSLQGTYVGSGVNWMVTSTFTSALATLPAGSQYFIHAEVRGDGAVIEAFLGEFNVDSRFRFDNNLTQMTTNVTYWRESDTGWGNWNVTPTSAGLNGVAPWGLRPNISASAEWLRYDLGSTHYFSTTMTSIVPLPPAVWSGAGALAAAAGLGFVRRRRYLKA